MADGTAHYVEKVGDTQQQGWDRRDVQTHSTNGNNMRGNKQKRHTMLHQWKSVLVL